MESWVKFMNRITDWPVSAHDYRTRLRFGTGFRLFRSLTQQWVHRDFTNADIMESARTLDHSTQ
jgi:hypothetical protein